MFYNSVEKFSDFIQGKTISFYGYSYTYLPNNINNSKHTKINTFFKKNHLKRLNGHNAINSTSYFGHKSVSYGDGDIVFLDQDAVKATCIGYPSNAKLVLISLKYIKLYFYIIIGLIRRKINKSIRIKGLIWLEINYKMIPWLMLENLDTDTTSLSFCSKLGVKRILKFLSEEKINYLVPRFYESLPKLKSKYDDLDLLVKKKDAHKLYNYLLINPGSLKVDVYTDTGLDYYGISYFPPHKAKEILNRSVEGPGNSKVPNKYDSLLLLIYHILYHKGHMSGLPSILNEEKRDLNENKYLLEINKLSKDLNISLGNTLEELDDFMFKEGWRPAIDTLSKISQWNEWVYRYHINNVKTKTPLYVLIIKNLCVGNKKEELLIKEFHKQKFKIIEERILRGSFKEKAIKEIRGGVWNDSLDSSMEETDYFPGKIFIIWDCLRFRPGGISYAKELFRKKIDNFGPSLIHSSDNYIESLDYIKICMPDRYSFYKDEKLINSKFFKYNYKNLQLKLLIPQIKIFIRNSLIKIFSH